MKKSVSALLALVLVASLGGTSSLAQTPGDTGGTVAPPPSAPPAVAPTRAPDRTGPGTGSDGAGIKARGFFMEVGMGGQMSVYNGLTNNNQQIGGSFLVGYKLNRLILGLGLEYVHNATYEEAGGFHQHNTVNAMIFQPTVQFHLLESSPLALFLTAGIHAGFAVWNDTDTTDDDDTHTALAGFHLGLGMRYFLHPRFCLGVEAGFKGLWVITTYDAPGDPKQTTAVGAFYGRIGFAAIW